MNFIRLTGSNAAPSEACTVPVETAIKGACRMETAGATPTAEIAACIAKPRVRAMANRPAVLILKSRNSEAASSSMATVAARNAR